jgi:hypothetical protein
VLFLVAMSVTGFIIRSHNKWVHYGR